MYFPRAARLALHLYHVLQRDVEKYQSPRGVVLGVVRLPMLACALGDKVQKEHIGEQKDVLAQTVFSADVDIVCGKVPYLYDGEGAQNVCKHHFALYFSV